MRQGMIQIYCGDGKGKTTAATGLAVRAAGSGMKVLFARFLKNENSAELCVLDQIPGIEVIHLPKSYGFYNTQSEEEKAETKQMYGELWRYALDRAKNGACDMLVMDEFMAAFGHGLIPGERARKTRRSGSGSDWKKSNRRFDRSCRLCIRDPKSKTSI